MTPLPGCRRGSRSARSTWRARSQSSSGTGCGSPPPSATRWPGCCPPALVRVCPRRASPSSPAGRARDRRSRPRRSAPTSGTRMHRRPRRRQGPDPARRARLRPPPGPRRRRHRLRVVPPTGTAQPTATRRHVSTHPTGSSPAETRTTRGDRRAGPRHASVRGHDRATAGAAGSCGWWKRACPYSGPGSSIRWPDRPATVLVRGHSRGRGDAPVPVVNEAVVTRTQQDQIV